MSHPSTGHSNTPRALIHKRILSEAAERPDASIEELAENVAGASADLVERVLEQYGDPGESPPPKPNSPTMPTPQSDFTPNDVTDAQLETLEAIRADPEATQSTLADRLGVSGATISQRLSTVDGFEWSERAAFVEELFDGADAEPSEGPPTSGPRLEAFEDLLHETETEILEQMTELDERIDSVESDLDTEQDSSNDGFQRVFDDIDLEAKVIRAVVNSDLISEDEELQVIKTLR